MNQSVEIRDVVVVGSGGAGLTTSLVCALEGLDVLVAEKAECFGGTTALSGGGIWVPLSSASIKANITDSKQAAAGYVQGIVGPTLEQAQLDAFLDAAPKMVDYLDAKTAVKFALQPGFPDWELDVEGAVEDGRLLSPVDYDGKALGDYFLKLKAPLTEFNAPGGFMIGLNDMAHITNVTKSFASFWYMAKLMVRFLLDRLRYSRGTRLTMGNALMARLLRANVDAGVTLWEQSPVVDLIRDGERIAGVIISRNGEKIEVRANKGVVLASGGFSANPEMRAKFFPFAEHHVTLVPDTNTGDGLTMAMAAGGVMEEENISNAGWTVMSLLHKPDGSVQKFPHLFLDRPRPGCIAVNAQGKRFADEAALDMVKDMHESGSVPAHLICDRKFIKKYGLGLVKPGGIGLKKMIEADYIITAPSLDGLAEKIGADAAGLEQSVQRMNEFAVTGHDADFGKGSNASDISMGDPEHKPNPCLGPIETAPFYAVKIYPGDATSTLGLRVDEKARVLHENGSVIPSLYAVGLDMNSLWRGAPPGNGANNTLSLTFGYVAGKDLAGAEV